MAIVYTGGTFDLLHAGHIDFLYVCKKIAGKDGKVIVGLNSDQFVKKFKGKIPICDYEERYRVLSACRWVDQVWENVGNEDFKKTYSTIFGGVSSGHPDFLVIGDDWAKKDYYAQMQITPKWLSDHGMALLYVARQRDLSSTQIKERTNGQLDSSSVPEKSATAVAENVRDFRASPG